MPTALCLIFVAAPIVAALSFELDTFVPFMILFCVFVGLASSSNTSAGSRSENLAEADRRSRVRRLDRRRGLRSHRPGVPTASAMR